MLKFLALFLLLSQSALGGELSSVVEKESSALLPCFSQSKACKTTSFFNIPWDEPSFQFWRSYYKDRWNRLKLYSVVDAYKPIYPIVAKIFKEEGLPKELALLAIVESNGKPWAVSKAGAAGLWQLMPGTARRLGLKVNYFIDERYDIVKSTRAAARYLRELYHTFKRWDLAIAAYNAGPGAIERRLKALGVDEFWDLTKLPDETLNYVPKFYAVLWEVLEKGLLNRPSKNTLITIKVSSRTSLYRIAKKLRVSPKELYLYNKTYRRRIVPSGGTVYALSNHVKNYRVLRYSKESRVYVYVPKRTIRLEKIARAFKVPVYLLKSVNNLKRNVVYRGEVVIIVKAKGKLNGEKGQS
ncbi:transglycosylase SLT domain-containing protein [Thermovibrio sp.]